ncbi:MAG TPA: ThiF family adenylyltransferase [Streptosporangiaceae bacterium]|nr:ThiF family adenylyltransferase [Streptosporangiaceae bacterium]
MTPDAAADRYARQRLIPGWDQRRVAEATAIVIGAGAVGNEVAKNLALAGVGQLILCDPDVVATSNLSRTAMLRADDVGRFKAEAVAGALMGLVPGVVAQARVADLAAGAGLGELADASVVLSCVDSIRARMRLLGRCVLAGAALIDGGTHAFGGEIRIRLGPDEPCYGCTLSAHERGVSDVPWSCYGMSPDGPEPASIAIAALIGSWMSHAALQVMLGAPPSYRILSIDAVTGRSSTVATEQDQTCPYHRQLAGPVTTVPVSNRASVAEFLTLLGPDDEPFTWEQFTVGWRCSTCASYATKLDEHAGTGSSVSLCTRCGGLIRARSSQRLRDARPEASLAELGVAPEEILPVRVPGGEYECQRLSR